MGTPPPPGALDPISLSLSLLFSFPPRSSTLKIVIIRRLWSHSSVSFGGKSTDSRESLEAPRPFYWQPTFPLPLIAAFGSKRASLVALASCIAMALASPRHSSAAWASRGASQSAREDRGSSAASASRGASQPARADRHASAAGASQPAREDGASSAPAAAVPARRL